MKLSGRLMAIFPKKEHLFVSIIGGGGKTTLLETLGGALKAQGKSVLLTTTTRIESPLARSWQVDRVVENTHDALLYYPKKGEVVLFALKYEDVLRLKAPEMETLRVLLSRYDAVLAEADGSRHLPMKWHSAKDPVIPSFNDYTLCVFGAWGMGKERREVVFGLGEEGKVDGTFLQKYLDAPEGLLKGSQTGRRAVVINGWNNVTREEANVFSEVQWPDGCVILHSSIKDDETYD
ncbi:MAG: putative selenium-dependent hydroxylase accessory protein YqeC [Spirochaetales bacterium]|nr:putative selenium-dependent hydroxylase accessory protein YqeC [Candidatus Physcosoma equi]